MILLKVHDFKLVKLTKGGAEMDKREKRLREILRILSQADKLDVSDIVIDMIYSILIHA